MPSRRDALTHGERLLIRGARMIVLQGGCAGLQGCFEQVCGAAGEEAYRALQVFLQQLGAWGRRRVRLSVPADPRLTPDEAAVLDVFGCAQADDYAAMDDRLAALAGGPVPPALGAAVVWVAQAFAAGGLELRPSVPAAQAPVGLRFAAE